MLSYPDTLILTAAGNSGASGDNTVYSPALSKNGLSVGASLSLRDRNNDISAVVSFSSRGPSADGRIKPDFVTPGQTLLSAKAGSSCAVVSKQGELLLPCLERRGACV